MAIRAEAIKDQMTKSITEFIQKEVLLPRLKNASVLVVYDPARRYRELCLELDDDSRQVIDAGQSSIESREVALATLLELGRPQATIKEMLVYIPAAAPRTDEERQRDPFSLYAACGAVFPEGDGDEYLALCLKAKADHGAAIRRIFADNPNPDFAVIDAVGGGVGWPQLQAALGAESARGILLALLAPSDEQKSQLKAGEGWVAEARTLFQHALGLNLLTKAKRWDAIADELWRFLLFSEFALDSPGELPPALANVPRAGPEARELVFNLCATLRHDGRTKPHYIEQAEAVEVALKLPELCRGIAELGARDTFPFEEKSLFTQAVVALEQDHPDRFRQLLAERQDSVWTGQGESQAKWQLLQSAAELLQACQDAERQLTDHSRNQEALIDFYTGSLRDVDRRQREFEQMASDSFDHSDHATAIIDRARTMYRRFSEQVQTLFIRYLEQAGWPPAGRLANADVFDRLVAPKLQESGRRTAFFLIDALRYELGIELQRLLATDNPTEIQAAYAQLPTVTPVGMASLLPGAGSDLSLARKDDRFVPMLGDKPLPAVTQRMDVLRNRYGQRFAEVALKEFARSKTPLPDTAELVVIRSNEMDNDFESNPEAALGQVRRTFQQVSAAIRKLHDAGFQDAIIATDHGFYLNAALEAGDICGKPPGQWVNAHERLLLGDGASDTGSYVLPAERLGIRGDFNQAAGPRSMVAYRAGQWYLHGGASLQEAVVPVLTIRLKPQAESFGKTPGVKLSYKRGAKRVTTRRPVIDVQVEVGDLFGLGADVTFLIEAQDKQGNVVGEPMPSEPVNPATMAVSLPPGASAQITLKMALDFEGQFTIKALDPTTLMTYDKLDLETDYTV